jgi:hypothetical protein
MIIHRGLAVWGRPRRGRIPHYHRDVRALPWLLLLVLIASLGVAGLFLANPHDLEPGQLSAVELSGRRLQPGNVCVAIAADLT